MMFENKWFDNEHKFVNAIKVKLRVYGFSSILAQLYLKHQLGQIY